MTTDLSNKPAQSAGVLAVLTNLPNLESAQVLAEALVEQQLAACVNILPPVQSVYRWQGQLMHETEVTLLIKTTEEAYTALEQAIRIAHPYEVPEIIALPATHVFSPYADWVRQSVRGNHEA